MPQIFQSFRILEEEVRNQESKGQEKCWHLELYTIWNVPESFIHALPGSSEAPVCGPYRWATAAHLRPRAFPGGAGGFGGPVRGRRVWWPGDAGWIDEAWWIPWDGKVFFAGLDGCWPMGTLAGAWVPMQKKARQRWDNRWLHWPLRFGVRNRCCGVFGQTREPEVERMPTLRCSGITCQSCSGTIQEEKDSQQWFGKNWEVRVWMDTAVVIEKVTVTALYFPDKLRKSGYDQTVIRFLSICCSFAATPSRRHPAWVAACFSVTRHLWPCGFTLRDGGAARWARATGRGKCFAAAFPLPSLCQA